MDDFKFPCPACGQRISCDAEHSGRELVCPTCNAAIVVPSEIAPLGSSSPPPIPESVKPAAADAPVEAVELTAVDAPVEAAPRTSKLAIASLVCSLSSLLVCIGWIPGLICGHMARAGIRRDPSLKGNGMATAGLAIGYVMLASTVIASVIAVLYFSAVLKVVQQAQLEMATNSVTVPVAPTQSGTVPNDHPPVEFEKPKWTTDVINAPFPDHTVSGKIHGFDFIDTKTTFRNADIKFDSGTGIELTIHGLGAGVENSSHEYQPATDSNAPQIKIKWTEGGQSKTETFATGYSMKLKFDKAMKRKVHAQIYLSLPDDAKSCVAGTFTITLPKKKQ